MRIKALCFALFAVCMAAGVVHAVEALPDLIVESVTWEYLRGHGEYKGRVHPGDTIVVHVKVKNIGQVPSGQFNVELEIRWVEGGVIKSVRRNRILPSLDPYNSTTWPFEHRGVIFGEYMFTAWVHANERVTEFRDNNNEKIGKNMPVLGPVPLKPDLVVKLTSPDASRHIGRKVLLRAEVINYGKKRSIGCWLQLKCDEKKTKTERVPQLAESGVEPYRKKFEFEHRWHTKGVKKCEAYVDSKGDVDEKNELNNTASLLVTIK